MYILERADGLGECNLNERVVGVSIVFGALVCAPHSVVVCVEVAVAKCGVAYLVARTALYHIYRVSVEALRCELDLLAVSSVELHFGECGEYIACAAVYAHVVGLEECETQCLYFVCDVVQGRFPLVAAVALHCAGESVLCSSYTEGEVLHVLHL